VPSQDPTQPDPVSRFAVPVADLDAVHVSQAQMVELSSSQRMPNPAGPPTLADADDGGGGGGGGD
jgi:hypothetical protein